MTRPRVLFVTRNFPPLTGGMERLALHAFDELKRDYTCDLVAPQGSAAFVDGGRRAAECALNPLPRFLFEAWIKTKRMAKSAPPDLVLAGSGLTAPITVALAKRAHAVALTLLHGLDIVAPHPLYQAAFVPAIRKSDIVIVNSRNTATLAERAGVARRKIRVLHPGVDIVQPLLPQGEDWDEGSLIRPHPIPLHEVERVHWSLLHKVEKDRMRFPSPYPLPGGEGFRNANPAAGFRDAHGLADRKILLSVGRLIPRKGLSEFIERALPQIAARIPSVMLVIIGGEAAQALKRGRGALNTIQQAAASAGLSDRVRCLGKVDESILHAAYNEADAFVLPVIDLPGDVEGFGMVAVEAAAHGLPTLGFAAGGVPDAVDNGRSGILIAPGDYSALANAAVQLLENKASTEITSLSCRQHAEKFSWAHYGAGLRAIAQQALKSKGSDSIDHRSA